MLLYGQMYSILFQHVNKNLLMQYVNVTMQYFMSLSLFNHYKHRYYTYTILYYSHLHGYTPSYTSESMYVYKYYTYLIFLLLIFLNLRAKYMYKKTNYMQYILHKHIHTKTNYMQYTPHKYIHTKTIYMQYTLRDTVDIHAKSNNWLYTLQNWNVLVKVMLDLDCFPHG